MGCLLCFVVGGGQAELAALLEEASMPVEELRKIYENGNATTAPAAQGSSSKSIANGSNEGTESAVGKRGRSEDAANDTNTPTKESPSKKPAT